MARYELVVGNGTVVVPYVGALRCDVGVRDGRVAALEEDIPRAEAVVHKPITTDHGPLNRAPYGHE